jgi:CRISPR-associated protein Cas2
MRHRYIVCYDIANAKRLRRVFTKMHGFGDPLQYSIFKCDLSAAELALMRGALQELINQRDDRVMIIRIGLANDQKSDSVEFLGKPLSPWERQRAVII